MHHVVTFEPHGDEQDRLVTLSGINPDEILCVESLHNNRVALQDILLNGYTHIAARGMTQAKLVLDNTPLAEQVRMRQGDYSSLYIYKIDPDLGRAARFRRNADEVDDWLPEEGKLNLIPADEEFENKKSATYGINDWKLAWWREIIQNSVDACKAVGDRRRGKIKCVITHQEGSDNVIIMVSDNGIGMDKRRVAEFLLKKGGSQKPPGSVGGLGRAKELLLFSFVDWKVKSRREGIDINSAVTVRGKFDPQYYNLYVVRGDESQEELAEAMERYDKRSFGTSRKKTVGTTVTVVMKKNDYAEASHLERFLNLSHIEGITITLEERTVDGGHIIDTTGPQTIEAKNKIPRGAEPRDVLVREWGPYGKGSIWAKIYHMPHAKKYQDIIVRIDNLYMFKAPGTYDLSGKVIIELNYIPKGMQWDQDRDEWVSIGATNQKFTEYGPGELIKESRGELQYYYKVQLDEKLQAISKKGKKAFNRKTRPPTIFRTENRSTLERDWDELMEAVKPEALMGGNETEALDNITEIEQKEMERTVVRITELLEEEIGPDLPEPEMMRALRDLVARGDIHQNDIIKMRRAIKDEVVDSPLDPSALERFISAVDTSANFKYWKKILPALFEDAEREGRGDRFIQNAMAFLHWEPDFILYDEVASDVTTMGYDPNVDMHGRKLPKAPKHFNPKSFRNKEKRLAKYWTELVRFAFIVAGHGDHLIKSPPGLQVGFHFENPPKEVFFCRPCQRSFENASVQSAGSPKCDLCSRPLIKLEGEKAEWLGCYRIVNDNQNPQDNFRGIFITPAELIVPLTASKKSKWTHRYQVYEKNLADQATLIAIAFHEVAHALNPKGMDHDEEFASILTHYAMPYIWRYKSLFRNIYENVAEDYPGGPTGKAADRSDSPRFQAAMEARMEENRQRVEEMIGQILELHPGRYTPDDLYDFDQSRWRKGRKVINRLLAGTAAATKRRGRYRPGSRQGYYRVKCKNKRGAAKPVRSLADAMELVDDRLEERPDDFCEITAWYRDPTGHDTELGFVAHRGDDENGTPYWQESEEDLLGSLREIWELDYRDDLQDPRPSNQIFFRKKRMLKRRNPKQR